MSVYSPAVKQQMVWLSGLLPYAQAEAVLARIGKRTISDSSLWRIVEQEAIRLRAEVESVEPVRVPTDTDWEHGEMLSMDGGMVQVRQEGWKELKVGLIGKVVSIDDPQGSVIPEVHTLPVAYCAVLGDVEAFVPVLLQSAREQGFGDASPSSLVADGAVWIWNVADHYFPACVQIVDWYHARQHLAAAAHALFPHHAQQAALWLEVQTQHLFNGTLDPIITDLNHAGLTDHAHYFQTHQARMTYRDFRDAGRPLGSGSIESTVKQFKHRFTAPGTHWSRPGLERLLPVRAAILDGSFDVRWSNAA